MGWSREVHGAAHPLRPRHDPCVCVSRRVIRMTVAGPTPSPCRARSGLRVPRLWTALPLLAAVALIGRLGPLISTDFPLHDGGLFYAMASEIRAANFTTPAFTGYNSAQIPFAYPPLGLYIVAVGTLAFDGLALLRVLPLVYSLLSVLAVLALASTLLGATRGFAAAVAFALTPNAYAWLIVGGGVTRGLGLALALVTITYAIRAGRSGSMGVGLAACVAAGLTLLTHPEASIFAVASVATWWLVESRTASAFSRLALVACGAVIIAVPWLLTVVSRHGVDVIVGAAGSRDAHFDAVLRLLNLRVTGAPFPALDVFLALGLIGLFASILRRKWLLPIWCLAVVLTTPAAGSTYLVVPWSLLCGVALVDVAAPFLRLRPRLIRPAVAVAWGAAVLGAVSAPLSAGSPIDAISSSDRHAMRSDAVIHAPEVAVLTGRPWWDEGPGEWLPTLSGTPNAVVAQGYEWLGPDEFESRRDAHAAFQSCAQRSVGCVVEWMEANEVSILFVSSSLDSDALSPAILASDNRLATLFREGRTSVYQLRGYPQ